MGALNAAEGPDYRRLDLRVARAFALRRGTLGVEVGVVNLLDQENRCCVYGLEGEPGEQLPVTQQWLPRTPELTVSWSF